MNRVSLTQQLRPHERFRFLIAPAIAFALMLGVPAYRCDAKSVEDPALDALIEANKTSDVERVTRDRIAKNSKDEIAYAYLAVSALMQNDPTKRTSAYDAMEACIAALPQSSSCHLMAGRLLGINAMEAGILGIAN